MKILFVCEGISERSIYAQPWKHVHELARRMIQQGNEAIILTDLTNESTSDKKEIEGVQIIRVKKKLFFDDEQVVKYINVNDPDVINWHGSDLWSTIHIWQIRNKIANNIVCTLHSGPISINDIRALKVHEMFALHRFWNNIMNALCPSHLVKKWMSIPRIKLIIALSKRLKLYLMKKGIKRDCEIKVIRSGVDTKKFSPQNAQSITDSLNFSKEKNKLILYFGQLSVFRGVDTLLMAMPTVIQKIPSAKLLLLARGFLDDKEEKRLARMALDIKGVLLVKGFLSEKMLISYLSLADVVVLPFKFWPQVECPLTILEAMSMKKPVITCPVGAIPEIVHNQRNGILIPPNNPKLLAKEIVKLLENEELTQEIGINAREYVKKFYDWDIVTSRTADTFRYACMVYD